MPELTRRSTTKGTKFYVERIPAGEDVWTAKVAGVMKEFPERCGVCLEPATHRERWKMDTSYRRHLCGEHIQ